MAPHDLNGLNRLEHESVYVLREAFRRFHNIAMAWNGGKDAAVLLWLARRAFFGHVPFPIVYVDTGYSLPQVMDYRDRMARESNLQLVIASNEEGLASGVTFPNGRASRDACCALLKRDALQQVVERRHYTAVVVGLRRDDGGLCADETFFSPRGAAGDGGGERPVELFDQFASTFAPQTHVRVHPLLRWTEEEVWAYVEREQIPLSPSYFDAGSGRRYSSVDCGPCITAVASRASTVADIRAERERRSDPDRGTRIPGAGFVAPAISRREAVTVSLAHPAAVPDPSGAFRFVVQDVYRFDHRRIVAGRIESGTLRVGDRLQFLPEGKHSTVLALERWNHPSQDTASAGDSIGLTLADQVMVERGDVASRAEDAPRVASEFTAHVFWLGDPLPPGRTYSCRLATQEFDVDIATATADADGGAVVALRSRQPVALDVFARVPRLGRFVLLDGPHVRGAGVVLDIGPEVATVPADRLIVRSVSQVSRNARHARNGHKGGVIWFTGLSGSGKSTLATGLERELFTRGHQAFVLDGDNVRFGLSADLGFSARDRAENIRRVAEVAKLFAEAGFIAITAFISPYRSDRLRARQIMQQEGLNIPFAEVYLNTPLDVCERRDPKHLYARARAGELKEFTGISSPFEAPDRPELTIDTSTVGLDEALALLLQDLNRRVMF